jgi:hypothetical protein
MKQVSSLSCRCKEIILGSVLGDGSLRIHKNYKNARFSFRHSEKFSDYFYWKVRELKEISGEHCVWKQTSGSYTKNVMLRYQSRATEELTQLYELVHRSHKLRIRRKWLNQLTPLSLCVWWLDDGSLVANCRQGVICTDRFSYDELLITVKYFRKVWNLHPRIGAVAKSGPRSEQYRLWFRSRDELKKFLRIILPYIPVHSILYKVLVLYKDPLLQQRWISEVCELSGFAESDITACVNDRKQAIAYYRE